MTMPDTPQQEPGFDLSRRTKVDVAEDIARRMAAFRRARIAHPAQEPSAAQAVSEAPAPSDAAAQGQPPVARAAHPAPPPAPPPAGPPVEPPSAAASAAKPAGARAVAAEFAGAGLRASDPGHADVQTHPLFLHAHKTGQAARRHRAGPRTAAPPRAGDAGRAIEAAPAPDALYSPAFSALLGGAADARRGERLSDLRVAATRRAPAPRRAARAAFLAGAALLLATAGAVALWRLGGGDPAPHGLAAVPAATSLAPQQASTAEPPTPTAPPAAASPAPVETMAAESIPAESIPAESIPAESIPAESVTGETLAGPGVAAPLLAPGLAARDMPRGAPVAGTAPAPPVAAKLKPEVPATAAAEPPARPAAKPAARTASSTPGPLEPLADLLAPLTRRLDAAGRALGGDGNGGAALREKAMGNGGNK